MATPRSPEEEVLRLAELQVGSAVRRRYARALAENGCAPRGSFDNVEVLKRFASIADASKIIIVIIVDEGDGRDRTGTRAPARPASSGGAGRALMFLPILACEDGYGFSYGVRLRAAESCSARAAACRFPLTWGGDKRRGVRAREETSSAGRSTRVTDRRCRSRGASTRSTSATTTRLGLQ